MEVVLLDTNVLIEILKGNTQTTDKIQSFQGRLLISSITVMELYYGALDKAELKRLEKFVSLFGIVEINETISKQATNLVKRYAKSHSLDIPDSLIASTSLAMKAKLFTYNVKDFKYIDGIMLYS